jgi:tape measure domain-containing protein
MANSIAKLAILLTTDATGVSKGFAQAGQSVQKFNGQMAGMGGGRGAGGMFGGLATKAGMATVAIAGLTAAAAGATWATKLAADAQSMEASFTVMLGSADKAKQMMSDIQGFAASTPFETTELAAAAKSLTAFGTAQEQILPTMRMLGDLSSGLNIPIGELSELYGKAKVQGRLFMEDINQLTGRGIPIITQLAKNFGVAEGEIRGMVERGQVGFPQLQSALFELTKEGSMFGGAMEAQSKTFWGQWSTLVDNIKIAFSGVGTSFIGILTEMLAQVNAALEAWNQFWGNSPKGSSKGGGFDMKAIADGMKPMEQAGKALTDAADAATKAAEKLKADGESLTNSLRTPFEKVTEELREANELFVAGAISAETWSRAMGKAREDLAAQSDSASEIAAKLRQQNGPVAALQFGTQQAISAINAADRERKIVAETAKLELAESRKANELLQKVIRAIQDESTVEVNEVNL